jgi:hypothetical protein
MRSTTNRARRVVTAIAVAGALVVVLVVALAALEHGGGSGRAAADEVQVPINALGGLGVSVVLGAGLLVRLRHRGPGGRS